MIERCPDCGFESPPVPTSGHAYLGASPSCWALYGEVLAREYSHPVYFPAHRMTVDAYCGQHPGSPGRRTARSINLHLAGLYLTVARRSPGGHARRVIGALASRPDAELTWIEPPRPLGGLRVDHVAAAQDADDHLARVRRWAAEVWEAWAAHHDRVARLVWSVG